MPPCYNHKMNVGDIKFYRERWKVVAEIERQELRALTMNERWQQINALAQFAIDQRIQRKDDDGEMDVFKRWAKLKGQHEVG